MLFGGNVSEIGNKATFSWSNFCLLRWPPSTFWGLCSAQSVKWRIITRITAHGRPAGSDATMRRVAPAAETEIPARYVGGAET